MDPSRVASLSREVAGRFGADAAAVRVVYAPYRICPLGAHIDHQLGPVTAMAVDRGVYLAYVGTGTRQVRLNSLSFAGEVRFDLDAVPPRHGDEWGNYARGAAVALQERHALAQGICGVTSGDPVEGGLSSSAAVGVAYLLALEEANGLQVGAADNVRLDQAIENGYLGLRNGILDQSAILHSRRGHLTLIDCARAEVTLVPPSPRMPAFAVLVAGSGLRRALVNTDYNRRVEECAQAASALLQVCGRGQETPLLGNLRPAEYAAHRQVLAGPPARRAAHYFGEVDRVERGVEAWRRGDLVELGRLVSASGRSSIDHYECGSPPLIDLYQILVGITGVYGARFSGAGFRGCCVALVDLRAADQALAAVRREYGARHPDLAARAAAWLCQPDDGARFVAAPPGNGP